MPMLRILSDDEKEMLRRVALASESFKKARKRAQENNAEFKVPRRVLIKNGGAAIREENEDEIEIINGRKRLTQKKVKKVEGVQEVQEVKEFKEVKLGKEVKEVKEVKLGKEVGNVVQKKAPKIIICEEKEEEVKLTTSSPLSLKKPSQSFRALSVQQYEKEQAQGMQVSDRQLLIIKRVFFPSRSQEGFKSP